MAKKLSTFFALLAVLTFEVMLAIVVWNYAQLKYTGEFGLTSFPPETAFVYCVPFGGGILLWTALAVAFWKKHRKEIQAKSLINEKYKQNNL